MISREMAEKYAFYVCAAGAAFSPLGPVVHYTCWGIALLFLLYLRIVFGVPLLNTGNAWGRKSLLLFGGVFAWIACVGLLTADSLFAYGRNVSIVFEMAFGVWLAARLLCTDEKRQKFIQLFAAATVFICLGVLLREYGIIPYFPNSTLIRNSNSLGGFAAFCAAPLGVFVFWTLQGRMALQLCVLTLLDVVLLVSFASGAWLAGFACACVILWYGVKYKKIRVKFLTALAVFTFACIACINWATDGAILNSFSREYEQMTSVRDPEKLTTYRNEIWNVTLYLFNQRPITGWGGKDFKKLYDEVFATKKEQLGLKLDLHGCHPHNTFLYLLYLGGVPALLLFAGALYYVMRKSLRLARSEANTLYAWGVMSAAMTVCVLVNGLTGDVLQGRRDVAVIVWTVWGLIAGLPMERTESEQK